MLVLLNLGLAGMNFYMYAKYRQKANLFSGMVCIFLSLVCFGLRV